MAGREIGQGVRHASAWALDGVDALTYSRGACSSPATRPLVPHAASRAADGHSHRRESPFPISRCAIVATSPHRSLLFCPQRCCRGLYAASGPKAMPDNWDDSGDDDDWEANDFTLPGANDKKDEDAVVGRRRP